MVTKFKITWLIAALFIFAFTGCVVDDSPGPVGPTGPQGPAGLDGEDATVYYSEWFSPEAWSGDVGDWYFAEIAPDLTEDVVEGGIILAYCWLEGDLYEGTTIRPLPAYALNANWSFLIHEYGSIEFTCDMIDVPATSGHFFRFVAIPGTIPALKSAKANNISKEDIMEMTYPEVCEMFNIPQ